MATKQGKICGTVVYSNGDGPQQEIPIGPCTIEATSQETTISWGDGDSSSMALLPFDTYTLYLTGGAIVLESAG